MMFDTELEAARAWVSELTRIPMSVVEKLANANENDLYEITPVSVYDRVYIIGGDYEDRSGEVVARNTDGSLDVVLDGPTRERVSIEPQYLEPEFDDRFPMWGTMWAFSDITDNEWLSGEYLGPHFDEMADCGFRIYESEDYGYIFGIDGCGYDFYESHWVPLYRARGLKWHKGAEDED